MRWKRNIFLHFFEGEIIDLLTYFLPNTSSNAEKKYFFIAEKSRKRREGEMRQKVCELVWGEKESNRERWEGGRKQNSHGERERKIKREGKRGRERGE